MADCRSGLALAGFASAANPYQALNKTIYGSVMTTARDSAGLVLRLVSHRAAWYSRPLRLKIPCLTVLVSFPLLNSWRAIWQVAIVEKVPKSSDLFHCTKRLLDIRLVISTARILSSLIKSESGKPRDRHRSKSKKQTFGCVETVLGYMVKGATINNFQLLHVSRH